MKPLPILASELIEELDREYPEKCADPDDPEREIWIKVGQRKLINNLLYRMRYFKDEMKKHLKGGDNVYEQTGCS